MLPISIDDKHGFHDMIQQLNPRYQLPHKDYFSCHAIPALYAEACDQMEKKLKTDMGHSLVYHLNLRSWNFS